MARICLAVAAVALALSAPLSAQTPPSVAQLDPPHGAIEVDPGRTTLQVTFGQPMNTQVGWSICGGGATFPQVSKIRWLDDRRLEVQCRLQPGQRYEMPLNCTRSSQRFATANGVRLPPTPWSFTAGAPDGTPAADQPERNAAALAAAFDAIDSAYSYRDRVVTDWAKLQTAARAHLLEAPNDRAFADRLAQALAPARDPHLWIKDAHGLRPSFEQPAAHNVNAALLPELVEGFERFNRAAWVGRFTAGTDDPADDVGYLALLTFSNQQLGDVNQALELLEELRDCRALILDLRLNGGGNEMLAMRFAAWFASELKVYAQQVTCNPRSGAWDLVRQRRMSAVNKAPKRYDGPVYALIGPGVMSSAEGFTLMLRQCPGVTLVGAPTRGSSGNPKPHPLPNGVELWLPSWRALDADGEPIEGRGIAPDLPVAATPQQLRKTDPVLARALALAREG